MKTALLVGFGIASALTCLYFLVRAVYVFKKGGTTKQVLSAIQMFTMGVFISTVLMFIPICYTDCSLEDSYGYIRPFLLALHNALRVFILDTDFKIVVDALKCQPAALHVLFSLYAAVLYVLAPVLTFSTVLSAFVNINDIVRYRWHRFRKHYILSELNERSLALARSISDSGEKAVIVFTGIPAHAEDDKLGLLDQARDLKAICLRRDVTSLNIISKKGDVEIFLIGQDESENVNKAITITRDLNEKNKKYNVKVFVFCSKPGTAVVVDSIKYDKLLDHAAKNGYSEKCFKLRRIDEKRQMMWNLVPEMGLFDVAMRHDQCLSVLICGLGSYGMEFLKTVLWYCQFEGFKLQINIVDKQGKQEWDKDRVKKLIDRACPELLKTNRTDVQGEAYYDIEIIPGIDMETSDFDELLLYSDEDEEKMALSQRLKGTDLAFVSLGDDDMDIEVAIHLRSLFDRVNGLEAKKNITWAQEPVDIYAVVFDDGKTEILNSKNDSAREMRNFKDVPYHIHFVGAMSDQVDRKSLYDSKLEEAAFKHHISWVEIEEKIYDELQADEQKRKALGEPLKPKEQMSFFEQKTPENVLAARKCYEQHEYFRLSSIAKELYERKRQANGVLRSLTTCLRIGDQNSCECELCVKQREMSQLCESVGCTKKKKTLQTCDCENCARRKRSEHMRWNAYIRGIGYSYQGSIRADRAKLHNNLRVWKDLSLWDREKD